MTWSKEAGTYIEYSFQHVQVMNNWEAVDGQHWFCWFLFKSAVFAVLSWGEVFFVCLLFFYLGYSYTEVVERLEFVWTWSESEQKAVY